MTHDEYELWVERHAALFMMTSLADAELFKAWKPLVLPYALADFVEASNYLAHDKASVFRTTHLDHIRQRINGRRLEAIQRRIEDESNSRGEADCPSCRGSGIITAPHINFVHDGQWFPPYVTFGVFCHCALGRAKYDSLSESISESKKARKNHMPKMPLAFAKYEALVPNWCDLLAAREGMRPQEIFARYAAREADRTAPLKDIIKSIGRFPKPERPAPPGRQITHYLDKHRGGSDSCV